MLPTAQAFAWTIWRRHRWWIGAGLGYLVLAIIATNVLTAVRPSTWAATGIVATIIIPVLALATQMLVVFSYGYDAHHLEGRASCFPAGLFRLPVRTAALVCWPMAFGAVTLILLWLASALFILRPLLRLLGEGVPLWWPALVAVAGLAWFQALLWLPFGLPWLRTILMPILIVSLSVAVQALLALGAPEGAIAGLFAGLAAVGWTAAYRGVRQARHGEVPNWEVLLWPFRQLARLLPRRRQPFTSAAWAQLWLDWWLTGLSLPIMTALVVPAALWPLFLPENDVLPVGKTLLCVLALPVFLAGLAGMTAGGKDRWAKDPLALHTFLAIRPMTNADMVASKLKVAALSTLAAWTFVALLVPTMVVLTGNLGQVAVWWHQGLRDYHTVKVIAGIMAGSTFLLVWTWKRQVDGLFISLTGRQWVAALAIFLGFLWIVTVVYVAAWIYKRPATHAITLSGLPWLLGLLILCRLLATGWAVRQALLQGLLERRTLLHWVVGWLWVGSALFGLLAWIVPLDQVPYYYVAFGVLFALPMTRLAASPLVLAWNRHR